MSGFPQDGTLWLIRDDAGVGSDEMLMELANHKHQPCHLITFRTRCHQLHDSSPPGTPFLSRLQAHVRCGVLPQAPAAARTLPSECFKAGPGQRRCVSEVP